jgi:apolipoprotein N-acyltransferase
MFQNVEVGQMQWDAWFTAATLGLPAGGLIIAAQRVPLLAFGALAPLGVLMIGPSLGQVALAGALGGALSCAATVWTPTLRAIAPIAALAGGIGWASTFSLLAWAIPAQQPDWLLLALPLAAALAALPARLVGAPRWSGNSLACSQEPWLSVVHAARLGGDTTISALLGAASAIVALLLTGRGSTLPLLLTAAGIAGLLGFGCYSLHRAERGVATAKRLRVAAVVADGPPPVDAALTGLWPAQSLDYRDVEGSARRYAPLIASAAMSGARLVVLPEASVYLDAAAMPRWFELVQGWAQQHDVVIVAPYFNATLPRNELVVFDARGVAAAHEKQHPARDIEPPCTKQLPVGPHTAQTQADTLRVSTAICVDLDYADTAHSARSAAALLAAPSNDWFGGFERMHHRTAVWTAVLSGVPIVRTTGHGISAIYDAAGHVLAQQSSQHGPVVLVADVPLP